MVRTRSSFDATLLMQIAVVLFLISLGIVGIMYYSSRLGEWGRSIDRFFGRPSNPVNIIVAVAELVAGIIIGFALFVPVPGRAAWISGLVMVIIWIVKILWTYVLNGIFEPTFIVWLNGLSVALIVLVGLWIVTSKYA
ncbi:MAG: hypothetical protein ABSB63_04360 [Spirochaetia bacterium]